MAKPRPSEKSRHDALYGCATPNCRVVMFVGTSVVCPGCGAGGWLLREPLTHEDEQRARLKAVRT